MYFKFSSSSELLAAITSNLNIFSDKLELTAFEYDIAQINVYNKIKIVKIII